MAKILDNIVMSGIVPKILETADKFIINGQVSDKTTLEPVKLNSVYAQSRHTELGLNNNCLADLNIHHEYSDKNCVVTDKYDPRFSYTFIADRSNYLKVFKFETKNDGTLSLVSSNETTRTYVRVQVISQDVSCIYGMLLEHGHFTYMFRLNKKTMAIDQVVLGSQYTKAIMLKDTPLYIYYSYSSTKDDFYIGRYNKTANSCSNFYSDNGTNETAFNTLLRPMQVNDNEVLSLRTNKSFNADGIDNIILKKYIIDYTYEKVYTKNIELDCSFVPKGMIMRIDSTSYFTETFYFKKDDREYFAFWNKADRNLYTAVKTGENIYSINQIYDLPNSYYGVMPYNNGETLIMFNKYTIDFFSFRNLEERYELSSSIKGVIRSVGVDKNNIIWVQHEDESVDMVGLNVPTIAESLFIDQELDYRNEDIETHIEVFTKNFSGALVESDVEVFLTGPIYFSDSKSRKKKIKTSANNTIRIPVTVNNAGYVETNVKIL